MPPPQPITRKIKNRKREKRKRGKGPEAATARLPSPKGAEERAGRRGFQNPFPTQLSSPTDPTQIAESKPPTHAMPPQKQTVQQSVIPGGRNGGKPKARAETTVCRDDLCNAPSSRPPLQNRGGAHIPETDPISLESRSESEFRSRSEPKTKRPSRKGEKKLACRKNDEKEESSTRPSASQNVGVVKKKKASLASGP